MLVLTRRLDESIVIGKAGDVLTGPIVVMCCEIRDTQVKFGIKAQRDIRVHRDEIAKQIEEQEQEDA